jgi:hypothetical protein
MGFQVQQSMAKAAGQLASPSSRVMLYKLSLLLSSSGSTPLSDDVVAQQPLCAAVCRINRNKRKNRKKGKE